MNFYCSGTGFSNYLTLTKPDKGISYYARPFWLKIHEDKGDIIEDIDFPDNFANPNEITDLPTVIEIEGYGFFWTEAMNDSIDIIECADCLSGDYYVLVQSIADYLDELEASNSFYLIPEVITDLSIIKYKEGYEELLIDEVLPNMRDILLSFFGITSELIVYQPYQHREDKIGTLLRKNRYDLAKDKGFFIINDVEKMSIDKSNEEMVN